MNQDEDFFRKGYEQPSEILSEFNQRFDNEGNFISHVSEVSRTNQSMENNNHIMTEEEAKI